MSTGSQKGSIAIFSNYFKKLTEHHQQHALLRKSTTKNQNERTHTYEQEQNRERRNQTTAP